MEINFRNIKLNSSNIKNVTNKPDSSLESFDSKAPQHSLSKDIPLYNSSINNIRFNNLTRNEHAILVRELLNLPGDIKELLALLNSTNTDNIADQKFLNEINKLILFSDIQKILNASSKEIFNKLIKLIQPTPGNIQNTDQLKEILNTMQSIIPSVHMSNNEVLKSIILLYLPGLPLIQPQDISVEYEKNNKSEEQEDDISLIIYITTENIGRLKGIISQDINNNLNIQIECMNYDDSIKEYIENIHKRVNEEIKLNKIPVKSEIISYKSKEINKTERREISVQPGSGISPKVLLASYILTRVVFEVDERISLNKNREKMVQEKS